MEKILFYLFLLIGINIFNGINSTNKIDEKLKIVENDVKRIANEVEENFKNRCNNNEKKCLYISCSTDLPEPECIESFQLKECANCPSDKRGTMLNNIPFNMLANKYKPATNENDINVKELSFSGSTLPELFKSLHEKNKGFYKWMYYGSREGTYLNYPGLKTCDKYDNRYRPWYIGAATGAKSFILIIDISGSMKNYGKFEGLIEATKLVLDTLTNSDYVGLIFFNSKANVFRPHLVRATSENIKEMEIFIDTLEAKGGSNFSDAFKAADDMIETTNKDSSTTLPCKTYLMFFTDGNPTEGIDDELKFLSYVDTLKNLKSMIFFTYAFGNSANIDIPYKLACHHKGMFERILYASEILEKMNSYFLSLSLGIIVDHPIWIEPYEDHSGLGILTTCAYPVYDRSSEIPFLIGVVGIDIKLDDLYSISDEKTVKEKLQSRGNGKCFKPKFTNCQLNSIRGHGFTCELTESEKKEECTKIKTNIVSCKNPPNSILNVFCNKQGTIKENESRCCDICSSNNVGLIIGLVLASLFIITISIISLIVISKQKNSIDDNKSKDNKKAKVIPKEQSINLSRQQNPENDVSQRSDRSKSSERKINYYPASRNKLSGNAPPI